MDARWSAMGTHAHVVVHGGDQHALLALARRRVETLEAAWSRFRPESEVSRLNERAGTPVVVSGATILLLGLAVQGWRITDGLFDPTVLGAVEAWGYDETFAIVRSRSLDGPRRPGRRTGCGGIEVDPADGTVTLPDGVGFDPGGIGKGLAADLVAHELLRSGASGVCVNLGGDLRTGGRPPDGHRWHVGVPPDHLPDHVPNHPPGHPPDRPPDRETEHPILALTDGGLATSTSAHRRWTVGPTTAHHLIDPATGRPAAETRGASTVHATTAWRAELLATAATVRAQHDTETWVARRGGRLLATEPGHDGPAARTVDVA